MEMSVVPLPVWPNWLNRNRYHSRDMMLVPGSSTGTRAAGMEVMSAIGAAHGQLGTHDRHLDRGGA